MNKSFLIIIVYCPYPVSFKYENKEAQLRRMIDLQMNPIKGLSSKWDYEKRDWKNKGWFTPENPFLEQIAEEEEKKLRNEKSP